MAPFEGEAGARGLLALACEVEAGTLQRILPPTGFQVRMVGPGNLASEHAYPAGSPVVPPAGQRLIWVEDDWHLTPFRTLFHFPAPAAGAPLATLFLPIVPGGRIVMPPTVGNAQAWALFVGPPPDGDWLAHPLLRQQRAPSAEGLLMPAGPVIAGAWDRETETFRALSRPFVPLPYRKTPAPLEAPEPEKSFLVVHLADPWAATPDRHQDVTLRLRQGPDEVEPDVRYVTPWGLYGFWYDRPAGEALLRAENAGLYLQDTPLDLPSGAIGWFEGNLLRRPLLDVHLILPPVLRQKDLVLTVRRVPGGEVVATEKLQRTAGRQRFDRLVHGVFDLQLQTHLGSFHQQVALGVEEEKSVTLEPEVIQLTGTVRYGSSPHVADLKFLTVAGDAITVTTDEQGRYEASALQPIRFVSIDLAEENEQPWIDFLHPPVEASRELDFDLSDSRWIVQVTDATTGKGVPEARISVASEYVEKTEGKEVGDGSPRKIGQSYSAEHDGVAVLPAPRPGKVEVEVFAEGYRRMAEPLRLVVTDPPESRELSVALEPIGPTIRLRLQLPDGTPSRGAEVLRATELEGGDLLFRGIADAQGRVEVPSSPGGGWIILRHPDAAVALLRWDAWRQREEVEWTFPVAAQAPLVLRALDPAGDSGAAWNPVAVWVEGRRLAGGALERVLGAPATTDQNGFWSAKGLPRAGVEVLVWAPHLDAEARSGSLDTLRTELPYPWATVTELKTLQ